MFLQVAADHVIVAVGLSPNVDLAKTAGLEVDRELGGFHVNSELEARSNIWVVSNSWLLYPSCWMKLTKDFPLVLHHIFTFFSLGAAE